MLKNSTSVCISARTLQPLQVAEEQATVTIVQVHAVALAVAEEGTIGTRAGLCPTAVAEGLEAVLPHVHKVVAVDVAQVVVGTDAGTGGDGAVCQNGGNADTSIAGVEAVAHLALVTAEETLAAVAGMYFPLAAGTADEVHQTFEIAVVQLELGITGGTPHGENGKQTPATDAGLIKSILELFQVELVATVDASDDVPFHLPLLRQQTNGIHRAVVAVGMATQPVVVVGKAIEADGDGMKPRSQEALQAFGSEIEAICHHAPGITAAVEGKPHLFQVVAHQRFTAGNDNVHLVRIDVGRQAVYHAQKVLGGHVGNMGRALAVAAAMLAMDVAPLRTLPKELLQRMKLLSVLTHLSEDLQCQALAEGKPFYGRLHDCCFFSLKSTSSLSLP